MFTVIAYAVAGAIVLTVFAAAARFESNVKDRDRAFCTRCGTEDRKHQRWCASIPAEHRSLYVSGAPHDPLTLSEIVFGDSERPAMTDGEG